MNTTFARLSIPLLRWTLAMVVIEESWRFIFSSSAAHVFLKTGLPPWIRPALGISEIVAALMFVVPFTNLAGSYLLLVIFGLAALVHVLHGQFDVGGLAVYAVAVLVFMTNRANLQAEVIHDRR